MTRTLLVSGLLFTLVATRASAATAGTGNVATSAWTGALRQCSAYTLREVTHTLQRDPLLSTQSRPNEERLGVGQMTSNNIATLTKQPHTRFVRPNPCTMCYGRGTCLCGFMCFGDGQPCASSCCTNCCPDHACAAQDAVNYMNTIACDFTSQFRNGSASCDPNAPTSHPDCAWPPCVNTSTCQLNVTWEKVAPTPTTDRVCDNVTTCSGSTPYARTNPTLTTDRACTDVGNGCISDSSHCMWQSKAPTSTTPEVCSACSNCTPGKSFELKPPTATSDTVCQQCTNCSGDKPYQMTGCAHDHDRVCTSVQNPCIVGITFEEVEPTATSSAVCKNDSVCLNQTYQRIAPTPTTDRQCANLSTCAVYELKAPTPTSDRECTSTLQDVCNEQTEYVARVPTPTTTAVCIALRSCAWPEHTVSDATRSVTSDRRCTTTAAMTAIEVGGSVVAVIVLVAAVVTVCVRRSRSAKAVPTTNELDESDIESLLPDVQTLSPHHHDVPTYGAAHGTEPGRPTCLYCQAAFQGSEVFCRQCGKKNERELSTAVDVGVPPGASE